jgi:hypothetical protein
MAISSRLNVFRKPGGGYPRRRTAVHAQSLCVGHGAGIPISKPRASFSGGIGVDIA